MDPAPACPVCGGSAVLVYAGRDPSDQGEAFAPTCHSPAAHGNLFRCRDCATVHHPSLPRGTDLHALYREMHDQDYLSEEAGRRRTARRLLGMLASAPGRRLLEVGCGHGLLLDEARTQGYDVTGLELSQHAAQYAREQLGLPVLETVLEDPELDDRPFDVIVLVDVLEHLDDPLASLDRCAELLAQGGALLVVTPDPSSLTARVAGSRWWRYLPGSFCLLPRLTLRELLVARGLILAEDVSLVRSFSLGYWLRGLAERGGRLEPGLTALARRLGDSVMIQLSLGDERVMIAHRCAVQQPERHLMTDRGGTAKVHVVLPAYRAARTIGHVARALSIDAADRALLVDDASPDDTTEVALAAGLEVLRHPVNRGYGANQKSCYVRAALDGADIVVMVHADNQYDPALVEAMAKPIADGEADVVIGSRLLEDQAIAGGMPRWKWLGNRYLTRIENLAFKRHYSEYHTGYRAFSVPFLRTIPFLRNSDGFVFDQEIVAQIVARDARMTELAIPTRYFLEASSVSFWRSVEYGLRTLLVLARFRADHRRQRWPLLRPPAVSIPATTGPSKVATALQPQ